MIRRRSLLALASVFLVFGCDSGPDFGPPSSLTKSPISASSMVGSTFTSVSITVKDAEGRAVTGAEVIWAAEGGGIASPTESRTDGEGVAETSWTLGTTPGSQTLTASVGTLDATFTVTAVPGPVAALEVQHTGRVLHAIGDTLLLTTVLEDEFGNPLPLSGLTWSSLDPAIATVAEGLVTARAEGTARIVASSSTFADTAEVEVDQIVAAIDLTPDRPRVLVTSETLQLVAVPVDSNGVQVDTALSPAWSSSASGVASVSGAGLVEAVDVGAATITATAGALQGTAQLEVRSGPRPTISSITPDVAAPGDTLVITGTDFAATVAGNTVTVAGVAATVLTATTTRITAALDDASLPCAPTSDVEVVVSVDGLEATTQHALAGATRHELAVGQSVALTGSGVRCNEVQGGGTYVLSVFNTTPSATASSAFRLRGTASASVAASIAAAPADASMTSVMGGIHRRTITIDPRAPRLEHRPEEAAHDRVLRMNLELLDRLGTADRLRGPSALRSGSAAAVPTVGQVLSLRIPDIDASNACTSYEAVAARVVHVGRYGVVLEDTMAPLAGDLDAHWQRVSEEYDADMHQVLLDFFGDPLVLDSQLDDNDRMFMLFSKKVNDFDAGVAGFVFSGDFFSRASCPSSDVGEIFYGIVPTSGATGYSGNTADSWMRSMRSTVIHEVKHILSFASRISQATGGSPSFEDQWLEESTARLAEEFYARTQYGYGHNGNTDYAGSLHCEVRPTGWPECGEGSPFIMGKHYMNGILDYYRSIEKLSPIGRTASGDFSFYGSGWLLVRWAIDHSGQSEAAFVKALVGEPRLAGVQNLAARTGRSFADMLADFSLATVMDDRAGVTPARSELSFPTWDTRDIFLGLHEDFKNHSDPNVASLFAKPFPLTPRAVSAGDFRVDVPQLRGGTASIIELGGGLSGTQLLELLSASDGVAPSNLGLAIVRIQ